MNTTITLNYYTLFWALWLVIGFVTVLRERMKEDARPIALVVWILGTILGCISPLLIYIFSTEV